MTNFDEAIEFLKWEKIKVDSDVIEVLKECSLLCNHVFLTKEYVYGDPEFIEIINKSVNAKRGNK